MPIQYTIHDINESDGQKSVLISASSGDTTIKKWFVIDDTLDKVAVRNTLLNELNKQIRINNQTEALKLLIGKPF